MSTRSAFLVGAIALATAGSMMLTPSAHAQPTEAPAPPAALQERIAEIKKAFAESQAKLRTFEWIQTTIVSHNGEEKKRKVDQCYYGEEGTLVKVPISESPPEGSDHERGIRGRIKERAKEEAKRYMKDAADLMHQYLPLQPELIQRCKDAGNASIQMSDDGTRATVNLANYLHEGDLVSIALDLATNRVVDTKVTTTMGENAVPISLHVAFGAFPDGTIFTEKSVLKNDAEGIAVTTENSGYRPMQTP